MIGTEGFGRNTGHQAFFIGKRHGLCIPGVFCHIPKGKAWRFRLGGGLLGKRGLRGRGAYRCNGVRLFLRGRRRRRRVFARMDHIKPAPFHGEGDLLGLGVQRGGDGCAVIRKGHISLVKAAADRQCGLPLGKNGAILHGDRGFAGFGKAEGQLRVEIVLRHDRDGQRQQKRQQQRKGSSELFHKFSSHYLSLAKVQTPCVLPSLSVTAMVTPFSAASCSRRTRSSSRSLASLLTIMVRRWGSR